MNPGSRLPLQILAILSITLGGGCAKQEYPPGGPEDRIPPNVLKTSPQTGSIQVPGDTRVRIDFSEAIDRTTVEKAVFISPQSDPPPEIEAGHDAIEIIPKTEWRSNTTYVITVGTDLKDAHNVNLDQSVTLAFATGPTIDSGVASGTVYRDGARTRGISIALFGRIPGQFEIPIDSVSPDYLTQTGDDGTFIFEYLPADTFYLVAFEDRNRNRRINVGSEMIGLPYAMTELSSDLKTRENLDARLHSSDTSIIGMRSASINSDGLLKLRLTKPLDAAEADILFSTLAVARTEGDAHSLSIADRTPLSPYPSSDFLILTEGFASEAEYRIILDLTGLYPSLDDSLRNITYTIIAPQREDKTAPTFLEVYPADKAVNIPPETLITLRASEPLDIAVLNDAVWMIDSETDTVKIGITARSPFLYTGRPDNEWRFGREYRWFIIENLVRDGAGNSLGDSTRHFTFSTIGRDTLGSMSGEILMASPGDTLYPVVISFKPARGGSADEVRLPAGSSRFAAELLPGYYTVSAYLDRNDNGKYDFGSLSPYRLAEPFTVPTDTVRVRTRFESAGVTVEFKAR